jgi:hypothetical protein
MNDRILEKRNNDDYIIFIILGEYMYFLRGFMSTQFIYVTSPLIPCYILLFLHYFFNLYIYSTYKILGLGEDFKDLK